MSDVDASAKAMYCAWERTTGMDERQRGCVHQLAQAMQVACARTDDRRGAGHSAPKTAATNSTHGLEVGASSGGGHRRGSPEP
jgi:hypothetical protein